ncbi:MAG: IPT/TIG domain-containing protein [Geothrix sp.]|nr:IPT/TIG domain-containing protein [Geothrix sp.]
MSHRFQSLGLMAPGKLRFGLATLLISAFILACGGGGGGPAYSLDVSPNSLVFEVEQGGVLPPAQTINATFKGDGLVVGYPPGTPQPGWLAASVSSSTTSTASLRVQPLESPLPPGTYTTTLRFVTGKADGTNLVSKDVAITYHLTQGLSGTTPSLTIHGQDGIAPTASDVTITSDKTPFNWSLAVEPVNGGATDWLVLPNSSGTGQTSPVTVQVQALARPAGSYAATLLLKNAQGQVRSRIPVTYLVAAAYGWSGQNHTRITEAALRTDLDLALTLQSLLSPASGDGRQWRISSSQPWLSISPSSGDLSSSTPLVASLDPSQLWALSNGTHLASLTIQFTGSSAAPTTIPVTVDLALNPALTVTTPAPFTVGAGTTSAQLNQTLRVSSNLGEVFAPHGTWHASSSAPWLLPTASGDVASNSTLKLDVQASALVNLPAGAQQALLSVLPDDSRIAATSASVELTMSLPEVKHVAPYCTWVNQAGQVVLRGTGFSGNATLPVHLGSTVVTGTVVSDTEIQLQTPPTLPEGKVSVWIENGLGMDRGGSELVVLPEPGYTTLDQDLSKPFREFTLDPERQAVLLAGSFTHEIRRIRFQNGAWVTDSYPVQDASGAAISLDGKELLVTAGGPSTSELFLQLDPSALTLRKSMSYGSPWDLYPTYNLIAGFNDGSTLLIDSFGSYNVSLWFPSLSNGPVFWPSDPMFLLTRDRSRLVLYRGSESTSFDVTEGLVRNRVLPAASGRSAGISGNGNRLAVGLNIYDRDFSFLGSLVLPESSFMSLAMSPDGTKVYTLALNSASGSWKLRRTDISAATGPYPADPVDIPVTFERTQIVTCMRVSEDGSTLFFLTTKDVYQGTTEYRFYAVPIPR